MSLLNELLDRLGGMSFRLDGRGRALLRAAWIAMRHGPFLARRMAPYLGRLALRAGSFHARYICIVSHHFMDAAEATSPSGRERRSACAFRVPVAGRLESMCSVNALGLREAVYRAANGRGENG
jgi:hypothetical protein